ncbi:MAG: glutamyl-tRNA synthetase, glutamyl-tRNA synthetase [Deltaproteobacteria bacterium CSP1-8]|nr:MAG: glutamyl-tRNA synthetase, glutamyl-tRNA synthetase [Deltaproteobacteria bacterium CSP1-8]
MRGIVTRFAPSPTGYLHIGGARTALFNWLFARRHGGTFILRIEDTDQERSTPESVVAILEGMTWLGMTWDEGPYYQTERRELYREEAKRLLAEGKAYRCVCTPEELDRRREAARAKGEKPRYDRRCRDLPPSGAEGKPFVVRFKAPLSGTTIVRDLLRGDIAYENEELDDLVLLRSDGSPTYNFVVVVDDATMGITHVLRGDDHLNNTPKQVLLYEALGTLLPRFGHFPLIHGMEGGKLSKRQDDVSVMAYRDRGFLPEAMVNYLVRLGWGHGDQEIFSVEELTRIFSLESVGKSPSRFDPEKLLHLNAHYIKTGNPERLAALLVPFLGKRGFDVEPSPWLVKAVRTFQERSRTLEEMAESSEFYFLCKDPDPKAAEKFFTPEMAPVFEEIAREFADLPDFTPAAMEPVLHRVAEKTGSKLGKVAQPMRVALTGGTVSPGIFEVMDVLGRDEVIRRLSRASRRIRGA